MATDRRISNPRNSRFKIKGLYSAHAREASENVYSRKKSIFGGRYRTEEIYRKAPESYDHSTQYDLIHRARKNLWRSKGVQYKGDGSKEVGRLTLGGKLRLRFEKNAVGKRRITELRILPYRKTLREPDLHGTRVLTTQFGNLYRRRFDVTRDGTKTLTGRKTGGFSKYTETAEDGSSSHTRIKHLGGLINKTYITNRENGDANHKTIVNKRVGYYRATIRNNDHGGQTRVVKHWGLFQKTTDYDQSSKRTSRSYMGGVVQRSAERRLSGLEMAELAREVRALAALKAFESPRGIAPHHPIVRLGERQAQMIAHNEPIYYQPPTPGSIRLLGGRQGRPWPGQLGYGERAPSAHPFFNNDGLASPPWHPEGAPPPYSPHNPLAPRRDQQAHPRERQGTTATALGEHTPRLGEFGDRSRPGNPFRRAPLTAASPNGLFGDFGAPPRPVEPSSRNPFTRAPVDTAGRPNGWPGEFGAPLRPGEPSPRNRFTRASVDITERPIGRPGGFSEPSRPDQLLSRNPFRQDEHERAPARGLDARPRDPSTHTL